MTDTPNMVEYIDYFTGDNDEPMRCNDCSLPIGYDYDEDRYFHAIDAAKGCFLIAAEDRPDDWRHPLVVRCACCGVERVSPQRTIGAACIAADCLIAHGCNRTDA